MIVIKAYRFSTADRHLKILKLKSSSYCKISDKYLLLIYARYTAVSFPNWLLYTVIMLGFKGAPSTTNNSNFLLK